MKEAYKKCMKEKNTIKIKSYESPCGVLLLGSFGGKLCLCDWQVEKHCDRVNQRLKRVLCAEFEISTSEIIEESIEQLNEYFAGQRKEFSVPLLFVGTDFQKTVWNELLKIPFGRTMSYGEMARHIGTPQVNHPKGIQVCRIQQDNSTFFINQTDTFFIRRISDGNQKIILVIPACIFFLNPEPKLTLF